MSSRFSVLISRRNKFSYFIYLFLTSLSKCCALVFVHEVVTTLSLRRRCSNTKVTLLQHCFRCRFSNQVSTLQQRRAFQAFFWWKSNGVPYHYNSLLQKIYKLLCNFIFPYREFIHSALIQSVRTICYIFEIL